MPQAPIPELVAHRGYMQRYPENTWLGLQAALEAGACWLECDVQMRSDGSFLVLHDADFQRTGDSAVSVFDDPALHANLSVHEAQRFGERFRPLPASTLREVLNRLTAYPAAKLMVEIKEESLEHWGVGRVMQALLAELAEHAPRCVLISFDARAVAWANKHADIETGWVLKRYDEEQLRRAVRLRPDWLICNERKIPEGEAPRRGDWRWMLYDIVDPQRALYWARQGVDLVETADIGAMLQHPELAKRACRHGL